ncbi:ACT domain-containing protein [Actinocrinis sp.]|uniref:ACT domain-containing protein n=1 Tax=Actinocrinis sp. TaxID=1920516 RepID=UPI002D231FC2|nr:ACT domain-containing protein [Actinocrinis sp.]HZP50352.1 ACT domain-containing protein [Actinocrinis sp.]
MLLRLRIWVADRPGALGQVTRELGACGADIVQVSVLSRERGRALDEITVFLPEPEQQGRLERSLRALGSVAVEGIRPSGEVPGAFPDLDLLGRVAADPRAALNILADAMPRILAADWAIAVHAGTAGPLPESAVLARSWDAPREPVLPELPRRAATVSVGPARYACAPVGDTGVLVVACRIGDPAFHRFEVMRLARITEVAAAIAGSRLSVRAAAPAPASAAAQAAQTQSPASS